MPKKIFSVLLILSVLFSARSLAADYNGHWAEKYIENAFSEKIATGDPGSDFYPDKNITRAEFTVLLVNHMMKYESMKSTLMFTSFNDVSPNAPYFPHIVIAEENNIAKGFSDGGFHPNAPVTREDAIVMVCRAYNINPPYDKFYKNYADQDDISDYSRKYLQFSVNKNILVGYTTNMLRPKNPVSRAEALVILDKFKEIDLNTAPEFSAGYPKISPTGTVNNITLELKTTAPCTIFFKAVKKQNPTSYLTPKKEEIDNILAVVSSADAVVSSDILLNSYNDEYIIFLIPVAEDGTVGTIKRIKDAKALAYDEGDGSEKNPYIIRSESQLNHIRYCQNNFFKLGNDISLSSDWSPINADGGYFGGLDGNGHTISGLKVSDTSNAGLFSHLKGGTIKNLYIDGSISAESNAGIFAGILENGEISGCVATGSVSATSSNAGGIVGINKGKIIDSLSAVASVSAAVNSGGISGGNSGEISKSISCAETVTADIYSGGISGINSGEINSCVCASMSINGRLTYSGGRISHTKDGGITANNYIYEHTSTDLLNSNPGKNNDNGTEISWNDLTSADFYRKNIDPSYFERHKLSNENNFVMPFPRAFGDVFLSPGKTPYAPEKITSAEQMNSIKGDAHYILMRSINGDKITQIPEFSGSFDGNDCSVSNLSGALIKQVSPGGCIRNLKLKSSENAAIAAENYGNVENCSNSGTHTVSAAASVTGGIALINCGNIKNCDSSVSFFVTSASANVGGIAGQNDGFIDNCSYSGKLTISGCENSSSGGICGFNSDGFIYNCFAKAEADIDSVTSYSGGICGILASGEIFKCSSGGTQKIRSDNAYSGGIAALSSEGLVYSCFSASNITSESALAYTGGICGYNKSASIQCTYSINTLSQSDNKKSEEKVFFEGGICAFNENGFVSDNAAINPRTVSAGEYYKIGFSPDEYLNNNYAYSEEKETDPKNGTGVTLKTLSSSDFFFLPVYKGGKLGWSHTLVEENAVWTNSGTAYKFPVLKDVKNQNSFTNPVEFK